MTVSPADVERGLRELGLGQASHVLVHSSYTSFRGVEGGPLSVVRALVDTVATVMMPAFTWDRTLTWDRSGDVPGNAYRPEPELGRTAEPFRADLPVDRGIGVIAETFRAAYPVLRSSHPLSSFVAYGELAERLTSGKDADQNAPLRRLMDAGGEVLLIGVSHSSSSAIHLAEQLAGRRQFVRHALTMDGVAAVAVGGCSDAFDALQPHVERLERRTRVGGATLRCYELQPYVEAARRLIERDARALLCGCERCEATLATQVRA